MLLDAGSQLVAEGTWSCNQRMEMENIQMFYRGKGMTWNLTKSVDAPWHNGVIEALIKSTKRCLEIAIGASVIWPLLNYKPCSSKPLTC